jgi:hypothetical protein
MTLLLRWSLPLAVVALLMQSACKEPELIGLEVLPDDGFGINWVDTFTVAMKTVRDDSVRTSNLASSIYLFGEMNDPVFGVTRSTIFTQFRLPSVTVSFPASATVDSIVLSLAYSDWYGNINKLTGMQGVRVHRLTEPIFDDSTYYSKVTHEFEPEPLGQRKFRPDLLSNVITATDTVPPSLRVRLDDSFGQAILNAGSDNSGTLASNETFLEVFKGLAIIPDNGPMSPGDGAILSFNIGSSLTRVELYYSDSMRFNMPIDALSATHTRFEHEHPSAIGSIIDDWEAGQEKGHVQSMAGLRMKLQFPFIKDLKQLGHVAINRAELVLPLADVERTRYLPPNLMNANEADTLGRSLLVIDELEEYFDGIYRPATREYVFNLARHIQRLIDRPDDREYYGLLLSNSGNAVNARRAVFNGPGVADRPMRLRITYTIIE